MHAHFHVAFNETVSLSKGQHPAAYDEIQEHLHEVSDQSGSEDDSQDETHQIASNDVESGREIQISSNIQNVSDCSRDSSGSLKVSRVLLCQCKFDTLRNCLFHCCNDLCDFIFMRCD